MEPIWLSHYQDGVPQQIETDGYQSVAEFFEKSCQQYADFPAYASFGTELRYAELLALSRAFSAYLQSELGFHKGDRVAIMLPNVIQFPIVFFGVLLAGCVAVNINPLYTASELKQQLADSGSRGIIVLENFAQVVHQVYAESSLQYVIVTKMGDMLGWFKGAIVNWVIKHRKAMVPAWHIKDAIKFTQALARGKQQTLRNVRLSQTDLALLQYTGGTTGISKGAKLSHGNLIANIEQIASWIKPVSTPGKEIIITALPLYHIFSLTANCLLFMRLGGLNVLIANPRDLTSMIKDMSGYQFTAITGVNTLFNSLLNHNDFDELDFSQLHFSLGGGMHVQEAVASHWLKTTNCPLLEGYGLSETSPVVSVTPMYCDNYTGSVGLPLPNTDVSIRDDNGNEVVIGEEGELWVKGPQVMLGYWQNDIETARVLTNDGWLKTGDMASIDERGYIRLIERKKDLIIVSGFNVYPNEVESALVTHPGILEAAVIGVSCAHSGEKVVAYIVKKDPKLTVSDIQAHARSQLTSYKVPKQIEFVEELPKSNIGKVLRRELREQK